MPVKKKRKMDPKLLSAKQKWEPAYIVKKYRVPLKDVLKARKLIGSSRLGVLAYLQAAMGHKQILFTKKGVQVAPE